MNWYIHILLLYKALTFIGIDTTALSEEEIIEAVDVAAIWSVHRVGEPQLITSDSLQYVAYYDEDRFLSIAQRRLNSKEWQYHQFPVQMGWQTGSHARLSIAIDAEGYIHMTCYRRHLLQEPPILPRPIYYKSTSPHSIEGFEQLYFVSEDERTDYPTFITVGEMLYFTFRDGGSGQGDQQFYRYNLDQKFWERVLDSPLLDGRKEMSAYPYGSGFPVFGPDGRFHLLWMWRNTPDHATNHSLSYARTIGKDLTRWESAAGVSVSPPFTADNSELLVDYTPSGSGLSNPLQALSWDANQGAVISYHKFDESGFSQIYNARFQNGEWKIVPATQWDFIWGDTYSGTGALNIAGTIRMGAVEPHGEGKLTQMAWNRTTEETNIILDEVTLQPIGKETRRPVAWQQALLIPESDFIIEPIPDLRRLGGPMHVELIAGSGIYQEKNVRYYLRWEHGGANRDREVPMPWPQPTMLRVYKVTESN